MGTSGDDDDRRLLSELEDLSNERPANVLNMPSDIFLRPFSNVLNAAEPLTGCVNVPIASIYNSCYKATINKRTVEIVYNDVKTTNE